MEETTLSTRLEEAIKWMLLAISSDSCEEPIIANTSSSSNLQSPSIQKIRPSYPILNVIDTYQGTRIMPRSSP
ncbi:hypothetical protein CEXT_129161 [Caerostris extrusa]|nr:hypothetical protein CEXT_129161 [Caerostris extrusa]